MQIFKKILNDFSDKEKLEITLFLSFILFATIIVLSAIAWSRGQDVDYFKEKIYFIEERLNNNDKRDNDQRERLATVEGRVSETEKDMSIVVMNVAATQTVIKDAINPPNKKPIVIPPFEKLPPLPPPRKVIEQPIRPLTKEETKKITIDVPKQ